MIWRSGTLLSRRGNDRRPPHPHPHPPYSSHPRPHPLPCPYSHTTHPLEDLEDNVGKLCLLGLFSVGRISFSLLWVFSCMGYLSVLQVFLFVGFRSAMGFLLLFYL